LLEDKKYILSGLTGLAKPREIVGLLGPSGSGKTVLMNVFSDRLHPPTGAKYERKVYVNNNEPLTRDLFGKIGAYVMQDDVLLETLTPSECLQFSANLRLSCDQAEKDKRVTKVIEDLKLTKCQDTLVLLSC
jgi:ABC-type multidrug transport system ATPase subunit